MKALKRLLVIPLFILPAMNSYAHEPLYGMGPDVLFKGGFEPHLTFQFNKSEFENELAVGYGVTRKWSLIPELSMIRENGNTHLGDYKIESNYRFIKIDKEGISYKASFVSELTMPFQAGGEKSLMCALTAGQESLRWYWFTHGGFEKDLGGTVWDEGNHFTYGLSIGARPHKPDYYKPDLVLLLEASGNYHQKKIVDETRAVIEQGNNIDLAPTFVFSYRNAAIRGGVQFGWLYSGSAERTDVNAKITLEIHL